MQIISNNTLISFLVLSSIFFIKVPYGQAKDTVNITPKLNIAEGLP